MMKKFMTALALVSCVYGATDVVSVDRSNKPLGKVSTVATFTPNSQTVSELRFLINPTSVEVANRYQDEQKDPSGIAIQTHSQIGLHVVFNSLENAITYQTTVKQIADADLWERYNLLDPETRIRAFVAPLLHTEQKENVVSVYSSFEKRPTALLKTIFPPLLEQNPDVNREKMDEFRKAIHLD